MGKPLADYVKLPEFDEYKEWFKAFADLKRERSEERRVGKECRL